MEGLQQDASTFIDQRTVLIRHLSGLVDVAVIQSDNGLTLTTTNGTPLVAGNESFALKAQLSSSGVQQVFAQGSDITSKLASGKLAGLLAVRDQKIPGLLSDLNSLAAGLANGLNAAHVQGFDLASAAGGDLFVPPPSSGVGAAATLAVAITDPSKLAASSDGSPGSNGNLSALAAVSDQAVGTTGQTPTDFYAGLVFHVGTDVANGTAEMSASDLILQRLGDQRAGISGVSLDEEAANLVRYQRAYEASARVINIISEMMTTAINLGTPGI